MRHLLFILKILNKGGITPLFFLIIKFHQYLCERKYIYTMHPSSPHWNQPMPSNYDKAKYEGKNLSACEFFCKWLCKFWLNT